jgi:hypothetical protein
MLEASRMSSVLGLNVTPKKVIILLLKLLFNNVAIFFIQVFNHWYA